GRSPGQPRAGRQSGPRPRSAVQRARSPPTHHRQRSRRRPPRARHQAIGRVQPALGILKKLGRRLASITSPSSFSLPVRKSVGPEALLPASFRNWTPLTLTVTLGSPSGESLARAGASET